MSPDTSDLTVHVYARPSLFLEPIDSKIETLQTLEDIGDVSAVRFHSWPGQVPLSFQSSYDDAIGTYERFKQWAESNGVSIEPPFDVEIQRSEFTDEESTVLKTPLMCLALEYDGRLVSVFPHTEGAVHYTVAEAIAALETGRFAERLPAMPDTIGVPGCQTCGGELVNVQGLCVCHDCGQPEAEINRHGPEAEDGPILQPTV